MQAAKEHPALSYDHMDGSALQGDTMRGLLGWYRKYTAKLFGVSAVDSSLTFFREGVTYLVLNSDGIGKQDFGCGLCLIF